MAAKFTLCGHRVIQSMRSTFKLALTVISLMCAAFFALAQGPRRSGEQGIDTTRSTLTVRVYKAGLFKFAADNHEIRAPIATGTINESSPSVSIKVDTAQLRVMDPKLSAEKREQVQQRMLSPDVLDPNRYPTIEFRSTHVEPNGANQWLVQGQLTLHGMTRPISFPVERGANEPYTGAVTLKQTDFGMAPITIAGGTVKVKDEVRVEFVIVPR